MNDFKEIPKQLAFKWMSIPFGILCVLVSGASYNLFAYFQQIGRAHGYGSETLTTIKYTVLFGYYLGLLPGVIVKVLSPMLAYIIAAVMALISFPILGYIAENGEGGATEWIVMMIFLFVGSMAGSVALMASIVTAVKNFPKIVGMLIVVIMIAYFKISPYFEFSMRSAFFSDASLLYYFIGVGVVMAVVFIAAAFIVKKVEMKEMIAAALQDFDKLGILIFVFVEAFLLIGFWIAALRLEHWTIGAIMMLAFAFINFLALGVAVGMIIKKVDGGKGIKMGMLKLQKPNEKTFGEMLKEPKYHALVVATFIVIGTTSTMNFNVFQICGATGAGDQADVLLDIYWIADMLARFGGGLVAYFFVDRINGYLFAVLSAFVGAIGFGVALLTEPLGSTFMWAAIILVGISGGMFWVIVPQILMDDAGPVNFGLNWGLTLFVSVLGMLFYGELFDFIYDLQGEGGKCKGTICILIQFIFFGVALILATVL